MELEAIYLTHKKLLFSIAYRMLGSVSDAEDLIQDTFVIVQQLNGKIDEQTISNWKAYLCKIVTNRCIDYLKSSRKKRELYRGPWLPEPLVQQYVDDVDQDPLQSLVQEESISYAFLVLLERLSPVERAVFILREAFDYEYHQIAEMLGKTETGCRKILSRGKMKLHAETPVEPLRLEESGALVQRFIQASATGNLQALISMLTEDIALISDGGGKVMAALHPITTPNRVISFLAGLSSKAGSSSKIRLAVINGQIGIVIESQELFPTVVCFEPSGDQIRRIYLIRNPDKLQNLNRGTSLNV